jgi:hypothetical protein
VDAAPGQRSTTKYLSGHSDVLRRHHRRQANEFFGQMRGIQNQSALCRRPSTAAVLRGFDRCRTDARARRERKPAAILSS